MPAERIEKVSSKLNSLLEFLQPFMAVINCHMVNFITDKLWNDLPQSLLREVLVLEKEVAYDMLWNRNKRASGLRNSSEVENFLSKCLQMSLHSDNFKDVVESLEALQDSLNILNTSAENTSLTCSPFLMSPKKTHEVEIFGDIVASAAAAGEASYVVDVGGGKGYLGSVLTLHKNLQVLSVDSNQQNTIGLLKFTRKMEEIQRKKDKTLEDRSLTRHSFKGATACISPRTNLSSLIEEHFPVDRSGGSSTIAKGKRNRKLCLSGLHTCGNLASSSLLLFCTNSDITSLCSVGCCYNLICEKFSDDAGNLGAIEGDVNHGFPMSMLLLQKRTVLGRNARMLAVQALDRISDKKLVMPDSLFYRAVLQAFLEKVSGLTSNVKVGRIGSKVQNLREYLSKAQEKLNIDLKLSEHGVHELLDYTDQFRSCMEIFYIIRLALAPVVEAVILLDRLLYLCEQGAENVFLAQLFDPIISPRCFGIIAVK